MKEKRNNLPTEKIYTIPRIILNSIIEASESMIIPGLNRSWDISYSSEKWVEAVDHYIEAHKQTKFEAELFFDLGRITVSIYGSESRLGRQSTIQINIVD